MNNQLALIIEDDPDLSVIFAEALQAAEFETQIIQDGQVALAYLAETQPAVVVLDLHLPNASGDDILHHIRSETRLAQTRVIVTTADPVMANVLQAEADLILIKPISFSQLRDLAVRLRPPDIIG
jgi:DNA-binding response OmpR family regulator